MHKYIDRNLEDYPLPFLEKIWYNISVKNYIPESRPGAVQIQGG